MPFQLPSLRSLVVHALPNLIEGTIAPLVLFYVGYVTFGLWGGLVTAFAWSTGAVVYRRLRGRPVSGLLVLSLVALAVRSVMAVAMSSVFVYFLQPTLGTFVMALAFLASAVLGRPLTQRLSADLVSLPRSVVEHPAVEALHVRLSMFWSLVLATYGAIALWLLMSESVGTFLVGKSVAGVTVIGLGIVCSTMMFKRCLRENAVTVTA